ncbi:hypothetical protein TTHERM_000518669 (macronuclear) [Tetrahymena thermophila SB210]|uniref:Uncharacterized protein n=1 Tax=Tetrahymena thermophila (strain SB210) TaxID=312017 RepID=W7XD63_TETTS|nr:hypothetical protein TTHERM_000518669 [Tetrahymena thermophila SB210]EWS74558.1 hypothetical protein TTHERM_000518669 [Tetrahymena thermophila SB210]|eukprot:XP_012652932.1 hypothetical protein TTHERM_000518669 [Tetrahymena thermophila SB210]
MITTISYQLTIKAQIENEKSIQSQNYFFNTGIRFKVLPILAFNKQLDYILFIRPILRQQSQLISNNCLMVTFTIQEEQLLYIHPFNSLNIMCTKMMIKNKCLFSCLIHQDILFIYFQIYISNLQNIIHKQKKDLIASEGIWRDSKNNKSGLVYSSLF